MVFIAQINVDGINAHHLRRNQHAFQEPMRVMLQIRSVFESAWFAFVDVDSHQTRGYLITHDAPLATRRKTSSTQAAQARVFHGFQNGLGVVMPLSQGFEQFVATVGHIRIQIDVVGCHRLDVIRLNRLHHFFWRSMSYFVLVHHRHWRLFTTPHTGRCNHFDIACTQGFTQLIEQRRCASHVTTEAIAHANCELRCLLTLANDFKVMVEGGHLIHLSQRNVHEFGQGHQMTLMQAAMVIVDFVQMLNEQIAMLLDKFRIE